MSLVIFFCRFRRLLESPSSGNEKLSSLIRITRVTLLLCFLSQKKCIKKCFEEHKPSQRPTRPNELADQENDPHRPRPSGSPSPPLKPLLVRLTSFLHNHLISPLIHTKFPDLERRPCKKDLDVRHLIVDFYLVYSV